MMFMSSGPAACDGRNPTMSHVDEKITALQELLTTNEQLLQEAKSEYETLKAMEAEKEQAEEELAQTDYELDDAKEEMRKAEEACELTPKDERAKTRLRNAQAKVKYLQEAYVNLEEIDDATPTVADEINQACIAKLKRAEQRVRVLKLGLQKLVAANARVTSMRNVGVQLTPIEKEQAWNAGLDKATLARGFAGKIRFYEMLEAIEITDLDEYIQARKTATHSELMEAAIQGCSLPTYIHGRDLGFSHNEVMDEFRRNVIPGLREERIASQDAIANQMEKLAWIDSYSGPRGASWLKEMQDDANKLVQCELEAIQKAIQGTSQSTDYCVGYAHLPNGDEFTYPLSSTHMLAQRSLARRIAIMEKLVNECIQARALKIAFPQD